MTTVNQPRVAVNILPAATQVGNTGQKILFIGQMTTGTATAGALVESVGNGGAEDALFGANSAIASLIRANKVRNQEVRVDAIALADNGAGVAAAGSFDLSGTATEAGELVIVAGGYANHRYSIAVALGDTATVIGDAVEAAILADTKSQLTAVNTTGTVDVTCDNAGTYGNGLPLEIIGSVAGITTGVTGMSGGVTDPLLTGVFDPVGESRYQAVVWQYADDTSAIRGFLDARFDADGAVQDGVAFTATNDTFANLTTLGDALNSQSLVIFGGQQETETNYSGGDIVEHPMIKAAIFAGYRGLRLDTSGFSIADLVIATNGALDAFGGPALASKPYFNTPAATLFAIKTGRGFDKLEVETLLDSGISLAGNNVAGNTVIFGEVVTTYKTDVAGNPDISFKFLNYVDTATQSREYFFNNYRKRFAQSRLTEGDTIQGRDMANANTLRSYSKRLYADLSGTDFVLLEAGDEALQFYDDNLIILIDKAQGKATISMKVIIVTQLREIIATMQLAFSTEG